MEYYSIYEVAEMLNTSHTTIYNKLRNKDIYKVVKQYIKLAGKSKSVSMEGVEVLKEHISSCKVESKKVDPFINNTETNYNDLESSLESKDKEIIDILQKQIESLTEDKERLYKQVEKEQELHYNTQILFKQETEKVLLLEDKQKNEDFKGFWKRFFKNN